VTIQQLEEFDQGQRRLGLAVLIARESIDATAEEFGGLSLVEIEFAAYPGDVFGVNVGGIYLTLKQACRFTVAVTVFTVQDDLATCGTEVARHRRDGGGLAFVGVGYVTTYSAWDWRK